MEFQAIGHKYTVCNNQLLGKGSTGNVFLGYQTKYPKNKVAVKAIDIRNVQNQVTRYLLNCQIAALSSFSRIQLPGSQNIVKLHQVKTQGQNVYLIMELLEGGTLTQYLKQYPNGMSEPQALDFLQQMLQGYLHIRGQGVIHRDLKPDNIMFRSRSQVSKEIAIIDFGYCEVKAVGNRPTRVYNVGSPKYMAPEAYKQCEYSQKSDVWGLGITFYQMLTGKTCDEGMTMKDYIQMVLAKGGVPLLDSFNSFTKHILRGMLLTDISKRFSSLHTLREIKTYKKMRNQQIKQQQEKSHKSIVTNVPNFKSLKSSVETSKTEHQSSKDVQKQVVKRQENRQKINNSKPGVVFHQVLAKQKHNKPPMAPKKADQQNNRTQKQDKKGQRSLMQSKSVKIVHNYKIEQSKPAQKPSILQKAFNKKQKKEEPKIKNVKIDLQIKHKLSKNQSPARVDMCSPSSKNRINFNFVSQPNHPHNQEKKYPTCHDLNSPNKDQKINHTFKDPENKIKILFKQPPRQNIYLQQEEKLNHVAMRKLSDASPVHSRTARIGTEKLIGGFTIELNNISNRQDSREKERTPIRVNPLISAQTITKARQISLPKTIYQ